MIAQRRHLDVTRRHNRTFGIFVNVDELAQVWPALVGDAGLDVEFVGVPEPLCELLHASRAVGVDRGLQTGGPGVVEEQSELGVVVGVMVRDERVAQGG